MRARSVYGAEQVLAMSAEQSAEWDRAAREQEGVPERVLMDNAGRALAAALQSLLPAGNILAVIGSGHNGGDALIAARTLQQWGRKVRWVAATPRTPSLDVLHGHTVTRAPDGEVAQEISAADIILDGILGTGARGAPRDTVARIITMINESRRKVVAVDLPSGVDASNGQVEGEAVRAALTVTFGAAKLGLLLHPARAYCGRLMVAEIGFPPLRSGAPAQLLTPEWTWHRLPRRAPTAHKGTSGRLLIVAGSVGMAGAAQLATRAALNAGVGLVRLASVPENREILQQTVPEATFFDATNDLPADGVRAVVLGCGLGTDARAADMLERAIAQTGTLPLILDADALNLLARTPDRLTLLSRERPVLITPHVRELARVSGMEEEAILADPVASASRYAAITGTIVLLKGQPSIVANAQHPLLINTTGSSDIATAGMGDQLAGVIGAFAAAGVELRVAAGLGLFLAGRAADLARRGRSLSPDQVSEQLPFALRSPGRRGAPAGLPFIVFDQPQRW